MKKLIAFFQKIIKFIINFFDKILPKPKTVILENGTRVDPPRSSMIYISIILLVIVYILANVTYLDEYIA